MISFEIKNTRHCNVYRKEQGKIYWKVNPPYHHHKQVMTLDNKIINWLGKTDDPRD